MIITETIVIKICSPNIKHFKKIGYEVSFGDVVEVPTIHLSIHSHKEVCVQCDVCLKIKDLPYRRYIQSTNKYGYYTCSSKCGNEKRDLTFFNKYNTKHPTQTDEVKRKTKKTKKEMYGNENYNNMDKAKETWMKKYGVDNPNKSKEVRKKTVKTNMERYGTEYGLQNKDVQDKKNKTVKEKYNVDNISQVDEVKKKKKDTLFENFGVTNIWDSEELSQKTIKTNLERYGTEYTCQNEEVKEKIKQTRIERKLQRPDELMSEFEIYRNKSRSMTRTYKQILFDNWDGYDYYDNEYIKNNFSLDSYDNKFPTVDHKISILYGFLNNIPMEDIANISNLCVTKRGINISKNRKTEEEFKFMLTVSQNQYISFSGKS